MVTRNLTKEFMKYKLVRDHINIPIISSEEDILQSNIDILKNRQDDINKQIELLIIYQIDNTTVNFLDNEDGEMKVLFQRNTVKELIDNQRNHLTKFKYQNNLKIERNVILKFTRNLQDIITKMQEQERKYVNKVIEQKNSDNNSWMKVFGRSNINNISNGNENLLSDRNHFIDDVNERDEEINTIVKSINELADIFKSLSTLVVDQGTILDRIDYNMETAVNNVSKGKENIIEADKSQKKALSLANKVSLGLLGLITVATTILIIKKTNN